MPLPVESLRAHNLVAGRQVDALTPLGYVYRVRKARTSDKSRRYVAINSEGTKYFYESLEALRTSLGAS